MELMFYLVILVKYWIVASGFAGRTGSELYCMVHIS